MRSRLVRKWKIKSAAWAGVAAGLVAGPLAYALLVSSEPATAPAAVRVVAEASQERVGSNVPEVELLVSSDRGSSVQRLMRTARSSSADMRARTQAVAKIGRVDETAALHALVALAQEKRTGKEPNFVSLAALNALWVRGEHGLVRELADASPDPAVKSKALALARMKSR